MAIWQDYLTHHRDRFLAEFQELLAIPSVSTNPARMTDVRRAAVFTADRLRQAGFSNAAVHETTGHPVVLASWLEAPGKPTVLVYGHFDVQPPEPLELWTSPPFEPEVRDGRIYARGASDMKGNLMLAVAACEAWLKTSGQLPVNVRFLLEGEEEVGSASLPDFITAHRDLLQADLAVSADSGQPGEDQPMLLTALRGLTGLQVDVRTARTDLHSGLLGGIAPNALHAMVEILGSLRDSEGRIAVAGFHDDVRPLSEADRREIADIPDDTPLLLGYAGIAAAVGDPDYTPRERNWVRPTLDVNGLWGGYEGEGSKTVIPCEAHAKITCRLVPDQDPARVQELVRSHILRHAPQGAEVSFQSLAGGALPYHIPDDHPGQAAAQRALTALYGKLPLHYRMGASVPITAMLHALLGIHTVSYGFGMFDENMHAPNEFMRLRNFELGQTGFALLLEELGRQPRLGDA